MSHPLLSSLTAIDAALDEVAGVNPVSLSTAEKRAVMLLGAKVRARLDALQMSVVPASDAVALETGSRSTATWLAQETRDHPGQVRRSAQLGKALDQRWHLVGRPTPIDAAVEQRLLLRCSCSPVHATGARGHSG